MATKYWLQYHKYDEHGFPDEFIINTAKPSCEKAWGDLVFLIVGGSFTEEIAHQKGFNLPNDRRGLKTYILWEKFIIKKVTKPRQEYGEYEIRGNEGSRDIVFDGVPPNKPPILLHSHEFYEFRRKYMTSGFINIANADYLPTLLKLSGEN